MQPKDVRITLLNLSLEHLPPEAILTLTLNPTVDRFAAVDVITPDDKLRCHDEQLRAGGGGINVSRIIDRLGGKSVALYTSGGPMGEVLSALIESTGMIHYGFAIEAWTRENFVVREEATHKEYRFNMKGPCIEEDEWVSILSALRSVPNTLSYCVASGSLPLGVPLDGYRKIVGIMSESHVKTILDASGACLKEVLGSGVYLIKPNLRELRHLVEAPLEREMDQENAARSLIDQSKCEVVVLSMGAAGALLVSKDVSRRFHAPVVVQKSSVGAGDSMVAGIVFKLNRGASIQEAVAYGVACGAAAVTTSGKEDFDKDLVESLVRQTESRF